MGAVGVGVGHEDHPAVAHLLDVERTPAARAHDLDDRRALGVLEHVADGRLLDVEDLAADRQQRLVGGVAGQLGRAERGVALDDEQLGAVGVAVAAVGELGRQRARLEGVLAPLVVALLAGQEPGAGCRDDLVHDGAGRLLVTPLGRGQVGLELAAHDAGDDLGDARRAEHLLGLAVELRLGQPYRHDGGEALEHVVLGHVGVAVLEQARPAQHVVEGLGERALEAAHVRAALGGGDDVDERAQLGVVAGAPPQRDVDDHLAVDVLRRHVTGVVEQRHRLGEVLAAGQPQHLHHRLVGGEELAELRDAPLVLELLLAGRALDAGPLVANHDLESGHEEGGLPGPGDQVVVGELGLLDEHLTIGPVAHPGAGLRLLQPPGLGQPGRLGERGTWTVAVEPARASRAGTTSTRWRRPCRPRRRAARPAR